MRQGREGLTARSTSSSFEYRTFCFSLREPSRGVLSSFSWIRAWEREENWFEEVEAIVLRLFPMHGLILRVDAVADEVMQLSVEPLARRVLLRLRLITVFHCERGERESSHTGVTRVPRFYAAAGVREPRSLCPCAHLP